MKKPSRLIAVIIVILVITPIALLKYYNFLLSAPSQDEQAQIFVVTPGQGLNQIAKNLEEAKLIRNTLAFRVLATQMGIVKNIQAGDFRFSPNQSAKEIAQLLTHGALDLWITFPEGMRIEQQAEKISETINTPDNDKSQFDPDEYIKLAEEGYMFPDTYLISKDAAAVDITTRLKDTFEAKVSPAILAKGLKNGLTEYEVVILASLIERESRADDEKPTVAGILLNRLNAGIALQVDATVQYAKGYDAAKKTWWVPVSVSDYTSVRSPYNTYLNPGLPPTPISSPGLSSIRAAAEPADTPYFYYLHDSEGKIHYAETIEEHQENIEKYL
ncbi:MAG: endolytic transglycosylase MltG [Candidatus Curtissbacteria bacterium]